MGQSKHAPYEKPLPRITPDNRPYWESARRHELSLPCCRDCGRYHFPPGPMCPYCFGDGLDWKPVSGRGVISTWVVYHRPWFAAFEPDIPYAVVQVELEEGPRLTSSMVDLPNEELAVGLPVEVVFDDVTPEVTLPRFRRREE